MLTPAIPTIQITDGQVRRANILHSGTTSVSCIIRSEKDSQYPGWLRSMSSMLFCCCAVPSSRSSFPRIYSLELNRRMLYCANVGDSRAVLCRNGVAVRLTIDHKPNLVEVSGRFLSLRHSSDFGVCFCSLRRRNVSKTLVVSLADATVSTVPYLVAA